MYYVHTAANHLTVCGHVTCVQRQITNRMSLCDWTIGRLDSTSTDNKNSAASQTDVNLRLRQT